MARQLHRVKIAPKGMGLNDFVAMQEGYFAAAGLDVEFDWKTFRGTQSSWKGLEYLQRPQDRPYTEDKSEVIQGACVWGSICNASAGMGRFVADGYGVSPWAIFVRPVRRGAGTGQALGARSVSDGQELRAFGGGFVGRRVALGRAFINSPRPLCSRKATSFSAAAMSVKRQYRA